MAAAVRLESPHKNCKSALSKTQVSKNIIGTIGKNSKVGAFWCYTHLSPIHLLSGIILGKYIMAQSHSILFFEITIHCFPFISFFSPWNKIPKNVVETLYTY